VFDLSANKPRIGMSVPIAVTVLALLSLTASASGATDVHAGSITVSPDLRQLDRTSTTMLVLFQVAVLLAAAKLGGWLIEKIKIPGVIGELLAGVLVGPYLLGQLVHVPMHGGWVPLFPAPTVAGEWPINPILWNISQFASIILLFITGLHTDLQQFVKYLRPASLIATVGLLLPFGLGVAVTCIPPFAALATGGSGGSILVPALFVGAILGATSIGITARVLGDIGKLDTPEGVTILGAAVLDDVLGIIALAIVGGIAAAASGQGDGVSAASIGLIAVKAFGFWITLTMLVLILSRPIERLLTNIRYGGAMVGLALSIALLGSGAAEGFGLAFIIGAYSVGLGLSRTSIARDLMEQLDPIGHFFIPIFFAALGMLVNLKAMFASPAVIIFGLAITAVAIIGKLVGCGLSALPVGFNARGAYRIGVGMMPRGEVALIVAGIGLSQRIIGEVVFGVSIMMTLITTLVAPILLVPAFARGGSGRKDVVESGGRVTEEPDLPGQPVAACRVMVDKELLQPFIHRLLELSEARGWSCAFEQSDDKSYLLRSENAAALISVTKDEPVVVIDATDGRQGEFVALARQAQDSLKQDAERIGISVPQTAATA